jgi:hypothetical protein
MATIISEQEKDKLYTQVFHLLGMPVRGIELTQEQMDTFWNYQYQSTNNTLVIG